MPTPTVTTPAPRRRAAYENWRPPVIGVCLLVPVGADRIVVADLHGLLILPVSGVDDGQTLRDASHQMLADSSRALHHLRRITTDCVQTRRRKVITHVMATAPITREAVTELVYRDPRAVLRALPTLHFLDQASPSTRARTLAALQALATATTAPLIEHTATRPLATSCPSPTTQHTGNNTCPMLPDDPAMTRPDRYTALLPHTPHTAALAQDFVSSVLTVWGRDDAADDCRNSLTALLAQAGHTPPSTVQVSIERQPEDDVRIEVTRSGHNGNRSAL
jgi:hypothetical protein